MRFASHRPILTAARPKLRRLSEGSGAPRGEKCDPAITDNSPTIEQRDRRFLAHFTDCEQRDSFELRAKGLLEEHKTHRDPVSGFRALVER